MSGRRREVETLHVYFHVDELEELRRLTAFNDVSIRTAVRMIVRDFLIRQRQQSTVEIQQQNPIVWTVPGVSG